MAQGTKEGALNDGPDEQRIAAVAADPRYARLVARRARLGWLLSAVIFFAFVGYLLLVAFDKALLGMPIGQGVTSIGIPLGLGLILLAIALTGAYVAHANRHHDAQMAALLIDHGFQDRAA
ncbi:membrane protein [Sphingobium indicum IP26]|uniref:Membrane protein n=1 Tax=Sphingobium indicum F2 TaxID=1450518 RepID=A0A8E0WP70_9SPHN|nr:MULTISPECIES: DUF485 domain-containing protein [Sphingobium]EPR17019.1 membrane protein [Sphingobium indicum IP26]EQB06032.1 membrane protein [Sphingobium sp. HDIP04]KER34825.1 membrane protein [Sphingobium indicum F2]KER35005.1 membrane protein [Sphingobium indicum F2]KER36028.1 membrane protein [Sphingobium indicum F2]